MTEPSDTRTKLELEEEGRTVLANHDIYKATGRIVIVSIATCVVIATYNVVVRDNLLVYRDAWLVAYTLAVGAWLYFRGRSAYRQRRTVSDATLNIVAAFTWMVDFFLFVYTTVSSDLWAPNVHREATIRAVVYVLVLWLMGVKVIAGLYRTCLLRVRRGNVDTSDKKTT